MTKRQADSAFGLLFAVTELLQLVVIYSSPLDLSGDEAHYWQWSKQLDWAYYSKGPLVAFSIFLSTEVFGDTPFAIRFPSWVWCSLFSLLFYFFVRARFSPRNAFLCWLALRSSLIFYQSGVLMTTDSPAVLFWFLGMVLYLRLDKQEGRLPWFILGLVLGVGMWAKYTLGLLFVGILLFEALSKRRRFFGVVLCALGIGLALSPILYWNYLHDWVNIQHNAGHLVKGKALRFEPRYLFELLLGQAALVGPIFWLGIAYALIIGVRTRNNQQSFLRACTMLSVPLLCLIVLVSLSKRVYANWPLPIYIGGMLALFYLFEHRDDFKQRFERFIVPGVALNLIILIFAHLPMMGITLGIPGDVLPTKKLVGWSQLGFEVQSALDEFSERYKQEPFILCDRYTTCSAIAYYAASHPKVYQDVLGGRRMTQHDVWCDAQCWNELRGRSALVVVEKSEHRLELAKRFATLEKPELKGLNDYSVSVVYSSSVLRNFEFLWGRGFSGLPPSKPSGR